MSRYVNILPQYTIYLASETGVLDIFGDVAIDMIDSKIWGDTITDFPTSDISSNCHNLASSVGARNDVLFLSTNKQRRT